MRFSGIPQRPNPPTTRVAPSGTSRTASSADATTFWIIRPDDSGGFAAAGRRSAFRFGDGEELGGVEVLGRPRKRGEAPPALGAAGRRRQNDGVDRADPIAR